MKFLIIFGALIATTAAATGFVDLVLEEWNTYKATNGKNFNNNREEKFRLKVFVDNRFKIAKHNARYAKGEVSYALEVNRFTDMSNVEFVNVMNGFNRTARLATADSGLPATDAAAAAIPRSTFSPSEVSLPDHFDWRQRGAVTPVKDQGQCGSCYAFSATGSLEGQTFVKKARLVSLSEQNILDCSRLFGNAGCDGGLMDNAFRYIKQNGGLDSESSYPYEAKNEQCHYDPKNEVATDIGLVDIPSGDEDALKNAVATVGPISVAIDARHLQAYKLGIFFNEQCDSRNLDHGVLVVGYGTDASSGMDYWIVKNSWGADWGEDGYFRLARNRNNHCGIASQASYPVV